ncbi:four helix bundle protein [Candidatus Gottesmanbacteria bacterium]|nr:four helix bundle protein [Candidatus Gottesmanbacteria bacterium]
MKDLLVLKADKLAHQVYNISKNFPHGELFGITSQLRRSSISIVLNLIEGFARSRNTEYLHYLHQTNIDLHLMFFRYIPI